ncbi:protein RALF-like 19 [Salvia miltiorrhiza]|uniref:protein RALF-like 19 n=1 Tax=Salvia miltiorrhiza TaxID=226208 RepID=UPI0025AB8344|nr:protein RALF-like 19 [Salvia miltiorrhiza]
MMSFQVHLILVAAALAALATVAHSGEHLLYVGKSGSYGMGQGLVADSMEQDMMMDEPSRRHLSSAGYISYGALMRNKIPCDQKGQSYYNCRHHEVANPYNRGCTRVTNCARSTV